MVHCNHTDTMLIFTMRMDCHRQCEMSGAGYAAGVALLLSG